MLLQPKNYRPYTFEIYWKGPRTFRQESFRSLEHFCLKNKSYSAEAILREMKVKYRYVFEDDEVIIKRVKFEPQGISGQRPQLKDNFFWDVDIYATNWNDSYLYVIERVLARGIEGDWEELVRFYGKETVLNVFRNQALTFWPEGIEDPAREYFGLQSEDLVIYHRRIERPFHNIWARK